MQVEMIKILNRRCMAVGSSDPAKENGYVLKMILENPMKGILPCSYARVDAKEMLCFDITGKIPLTVYLKEKPAGQQFLKELLLSAANVQEMLRGYLIPRESLMVAPEQIFLEKTGGQIFFGIWPCQNELYEKDLQKLAEYLLSCLDPDDRSAAQTAYEFYRSCLAGKGTPDQIRSAAKTSEYRREEKIAPEDLFWNAGAAEESPSFPAFGSDSKKEKRKVKQGKKEKQAKTSLLRSAVRWLCTDISDIRKEKQKKKDRKNEEFFLGILEKENRAGSGLPDPEGTVLLSKSKSEKQNASGFLIPKDPVNQKTILLNKEVCIIGREKESCDIVLSGTAVSRRHARIIFGPGTAEVLDEGSRNGTTLNGKRLPEHVPFALFDGDEISFADEKFLFQKAVEKPSYTGIE